MVLGAVWNECTCGYIADSTQQIESHERIVKRQRRRSKKRRKTHRGGMGYAAR